MFLFPLLVLFTVLSHSDCKIDTCLPGKYHKPSPGPEPNMKACTLYLKNSCCPANFTELLAQSPVIGVSDTYWNRCGTLSKKCEEYMKKLECFYQCSPAAAHWKDPKNNLGMKFVPLCQNFCDDWFEACKLDHTCSRDWLTDWAVDEKGKKICQSQCLPYSEVYKNGTDLCESMWGQSFRAISRSCRCLEMDGRDEKLLKYITDESSEESSSQSSSENSSGSSEERACRHRRRRLQLRRQPIKEEEEIEFQYIVTEMTWL
ncbi:riboflavin-binding protein-like [Ornithorhynchus anatinus]|uniref:Folate receptor-like domain-containing protein n=1 Tax=Ornithorhynchus anatinus TaxID=9258 RepID=A0A6I8NRH3_ORNAN|nr:riboflavin-binding protein-like [Ornithorhynchus anatinus]